jgi:release factor glutamine methyltransferase
LLSLPEVFNAVVFRSGELLARTVASHPCADPSAFRTPPLALDLGTGTGAGAIFAARRGYRVIGIDINPEAVRCARINVLMNRLEDKVEIHEGDLFAPVSNERFHLVLFNPPFYRGEPKTRFDLAWRSPDIFERFASGLSDVLTDDGVALVLMSTDGDTNGMLQALHAHGFTTLPLIRKNYWNEIMTIYAARAEKDLNSHRPTDGIIE